MPLVTPTSNSFFNIPAVELATKFVTSPVRMDRSIARVVVSQFAKSCPAGIARHISWVISRPTICDKLDMESPNGSADTSTRADANAVAHAMNRTVTNCFICFTHIIPFRAAHLPRSMETRLPAASLNIQRIGLRGSPAQFLKNRIHLIHRQASRADIV